MAVIKNICGREEYTGNDGQKKMKWPEVGQIITTDEGKQYVKLNIVPDKLFYVFDQKKQNAKGDLKNGNQNLEPDETIEF